MTQIIGLQKTLTDPDTGAPVEFFTLAQYTVRPIVGTSQATFQGYVNQAAFATGKRPLAFASIEFPAAPPPSDNVPQWFYEQAPMAEDARSLADATLVYEQVE
jgi:hypothetical protein